MIWTFQFTSWFAAKKLFKLTTKKIALSANTLHQFLVTNKFGISICLTIQLFYFSAKKIKNNSADLLVKSESNQLLVVLVTISETCVVKNKFYFMGVLRQTFFYRKVIVKQSLYEAFNSFTKLLQSEKISAHICKGCLLQNELQRKMSWVAGLEWVCCHKSTHQKLVALFSIVWD